MSWGRRSLAIAITVVSCVIGVGAPAAASPQPPSAIGAAVLGKGPVGWDTYRQLDRLPEMNSGVATTQFASTDPAGANHDFWDGPQHCLHLIIGRCVIAEHTGAGEVDGLWFTWHGGDVRSVGAISIVLDGLPVLHAPLQDVVDGKLGGAFTYPLVGNADQSSGGVYIAVPMPFRHSMLIVTDFSSFYYHVTYRTFAGADGVGLFNPFDPASDVVATLRAAGTRDPKPPMPGARTVGTAVDLAPGAGTDLAAVRGPGALTAIRIRLPQARAVAPPTVTAAGRAFGRGGSSTFRMRIDPHNNGIRLTRRLDPGVTRQTADVLVDGTAVGRWAPNQPPAAAYRRQSVQPSSSGEWRDESVDLPAAVTAGKSQLTITNRFVSSDNDFNEFTYWVDDRAGRGRHRTDTLQIGDPADESAHGYHIVGQTWHGVRRFAYPLDPAGQAELAKTRQLLDGLRLRIAFDGNTTVDSPLGQFFGTGFAIAPVRSLMFAVVPDSHWFSAWWPMPYRSRATVTLYNGSPMPVVGARSDVTTAPNGDAAAALATGRVGYFHATSRSSPTVPNQDWDYLRAMGTGKFVGNVVDMSGPASRAHLEGNERVYVDGSPTPQINGTGTEDYYEGGWYFDRGPFNTPMHGNTVHLTADQGCVPEADCTSAYRLRLADAVSFRDSLVFGIQHGSVNDIQADYAVTAFWYGRARTAR